MDNLNKASKELRYDETKLCEVIWNVRLVEKTNKATKSTYYMAEFDFEEVAAEDLVTLKAVQDNIREAHGSIYRQDTKGAKTIYAENWNGLAEGEVAELPETVAEEVASTTESAPSEKTVKKAKATKKAVVEVAT
ncbi:MAG: hypothetical protein AAF960_22885 [Bacteroidota bacterium]